MKRKDSVFTVRSFCSEHGIFHFKVSIGFTHLSYLLPAAFSGFSEQWGEIQFDTVQLVYLAGARIRSRGYDVGHRLLMTQLFDNALYLRCGLAGGQTADSIRCC